MTGFIPILCTWKPRRNLLMAHSPQKLNRCLGMGLAGLALLLPSGCAVKESAYINYLAYAPEPSKTRIDGTAVLHVSHTLAPDVRAQWEAWRYGQCIANYQEAIVNLITNDFVQSGLFSQVESILAKPDYVVEIRSEEYLKPVEKLVVHLEVRDSSGQVISSQTREGGMHLEAPPGLQLKFVLPQVMSALKSDMLAGMRAYFEKRDQAAALAQASAFEQAALPELLASADKTVVTARARNRAIIAAKTAQFPAILSGWKTDKLSALAVRIEQTILDLNHECEVAKDQAQESIANRGEAKKTASLEELRGLAISYRERIELLKPLLVALKEEIANRSR